MVTTKGGHPVFMLLFSEASFTPVFQYRLDHPAGGVAVAGAGGQCQHPVIHRGGDAGVDDGLGQAVVDEGLLGGILRETQMVSVPAVETS